MSAAAALLFLFDVCVRVVIPEIKTFQLLLEADYSAASLAASAKRIFFLLCFTSPVYLINTIRGV